MLAQDELPAIVIDNGSWKCKAGFAGDDAARMVLPTVVGRPNGPFTTDRYVGDEAQSRSDFLSLSCPIENGFVSNWHDMEEIWRHTFTNELRVEPEDFNVLISESPLNPKRNREKTAEIMFETFRVPGMYLATDAALALYCSGRSTGVVVQSGDQASHVVPIFEGFPLPHAIKKMNVGGRDLTDYLAKLLDEERGFWAKEYVARHLKEGICYVAQDFYQELRGVSDKEYALPDGRLLSVGSERFRCAEALFQPSLLGRNSQRGIAELSWLSITDCDIDLRRELYMNIVLAGGSTMFPGFQNRLHTEISGLAPVPMRVKMFPQVIAPPERKHSTWIGGSILASLSSFREQRVSKNEYEDYGSSIVHRKCF